MQHCERSCHCPKPHKVKQKAGIFPVLTGIFIALLPKCPFCIMAYSSAITLCSGAKLYNHNPTWVSWISILLAVLRCFSFSITIGVRTFVAAALVLVGSCFILDSELRTGDFQNYYLGTFSLLLGVWVNGSFQYFFKKWMRPIVDSIWFLSKKEV